MNAEVKEVEQINALLDILEGTDLDLDYRLTSIEILGDIGDERALNALRGRMALIGKEYQSLIIAAGKLKRKLKKQ